MQHSTLSRFTFVIAWACSLLPTNAFLPSLPKYRGASCVPAAVSSPQLLEFIEPTTGVKVKLVGSMHYNPASIKLTQDTIGELAERNELGSIIIESCNLRWNTTLETGPLLQKLLFSEMRAAHDLGMEYRRPVILGDQLINVTVSELKNGVKESFLDITTPTNGGWSSFANTVKEAREIALPFGKQYLNVFAFFEPKLLLASPVAFLKYPFSYIVKSPVASAVILTLLAAASTDAAGATTPETVLQPSDYVSDFVLSALETLLFARIFLKELLADRNEILARNILKQCQLYQKQPRWKSWWLQQQGKMQVPYAPDSAKNQFEAEPKTVVAVMGMAHCNGVAKLLQENRL